MYLCQDSADRGAGATDAWNRVEWVGTFPAFTLIPTNVTGLVGPTQFRFFATNASGSDWSAPSDLVVPADPPAVTNTGATSVRRRSASLNGVITSSGGADPEVWFQYWQQGGGGTSAVSMGTQGGAFSAAISGLTPGVTYEYRALASNAAGPAWSGVRDFSLLAGAPRGWYAATNGDNTAGTNWTTALTDLQLALDTAEPNDTLLVAGGQTFMPAPYYAFTWTTSWVTVEGGYQAAGMSPGPRDPAQWPTTLTRPA